MYLARGSWKGPGGQGLLCACVGTLIVARRFWGPHEVHCRLFFLLVVMCTEPGVVAEELVPSKKRLSGQKKTEVGTGRLQVLLHSCCP